MAKASETIEAATLGVSRNRLGIGCHVVLVDGAPVLPPQHLPTLVDQRTGRFRNSLAGFVRDLLRGHILEKEIQAEAEAQIAYLHGLGVKLTHIDTHKHTHMFPGVLRPLLSAAGQVNLAAIRNPFEPKWSIQATADAPLLRRLQVRFIRRFERQFRRAVAEAGLRTTDGAIGVLATGTLNSTTIGSLMHAMPEGTWELVTHPAYDDNQLRHAGTRLTASREIELRALHSLAVDSAIQLIHFGDLAEA
jgi:predicted glycoside hydrolase/deacetylase ChbG (UPF0249 family)